MKPQSTSATPFQIHSDLESKTILPAASPASGLLGHLYLIAFLLIAISAKALAISDAQPSDQPLLLTIIVGGGVVIVATWLICRLSHLECRSSYSEKTPTRSAVVEQYLR